ncbi:MAG: phosphate acetyltransferase [Cellvibrionaceae bacterium]|jgi:phosphate acetyltransferase
MSIIEALKQTAQADLKTIVLPEGNDPRVTQAAEILADEKLVRPILLNGTTSHPGVTVIKTTGNRYRSELAELLYQLRKRKKGVTRGYAETAVNAPLTFGALMVRSQYADGCVAGAVHATRDVLQAALQIIGLEEGNHLASSVFLMILPDGRAITYGDCGMVPDPTAEQLANIAVTSAGTHTQLTGETPKVAMLSFSTKGSAESESVQKVRTATELAQRLAPSMQIDGELQFDAAFVPAIGERKAAGSEVAGQANVFIFPNLDAGNIGYKITERIGGAQAIGPLLQGFARPIHDLSRGANAEDIVMAAVVAAIQAQRLV